MDCIGTRRYEHSKAIHLAQYFLAQRPRSLQHDLQSKRKTCCSQTIKGSETVCMYDEIDQRTSALRCARLAYSSHERVPVNCRACSLCLEIKSIKSGQFLVRGYMRRLETRSIPVHFVSLLKDENIWTTQTNSTCSLGAFSTTCARMH